MQRPSRPFNDYLRSKLLNLTHRHVNVAISFCTVVAQEAILHNRLDVIDRRDAVKPFSARHAAVCFPNIIHKRIVPHMAKSVQMFLIAADVKLMGTRVPTPEGHARVQTGQGPHGRHCQTNDDPGGAEKPFRPQECPYRPKQRPQAHALMPGAHLSEPRNAPPPIPGATCLSEHPLTLEPEPLIELLEQKRLLLQLLVLGGNSTSRPSRSRFPKCGVAFLPCKLPARESAVTHHFDATVHILCPIEHVFILNLLT